jgi:hypothetical protein
LSDDARALAERLDVLERAMDVRARLGMDGDRIRARLGKRVEILVDRRDHQMDVEQLGFVCGRIAFTTAGPIVMLGTKWPSITSTWIQSAPAAIDRARPLRPAWRNRRRGWRERCGRAVAFRACSGADRLNQRPRASARHEPVYICRSRGSSICHSPVDILPLAGGIVDY